MNVLLVDDQISILSGLISGINWDALGVTGIRTAGSAGQARQILEKEQIDILLCDIEMPHENGLSLLRWARNRKMDFVCVFLTSHADFLYAKEAIQLDCFDYILQPARYEEIQAAIVKAIARVQKSNTQKELEQYGTLVRSQATGLFQNLFLDWSAGNPLPISALCSALRRLGADIQPGNDCLMILGHLLHWRTESWPTQEWNYAVNNIMTEIYETSLCGIVSFSIDHTSLGWFVYALNEKFSQPDQTLQLLHKAYFVIAEHFPCDFAFYTTPVVSLEVIDARSAVLRSAKKNNILRKSGVFCPTEQPEEFPATRFPDITQLHGWEKLLLAGQGESVYSEACGYLALIAEKGEMNWKTLRGFWLEFQQIAFSAMQTSGMDSKEFLALLENGWNVQSLEDMKAVIRKITNCFVQGEAPVENKKGLIEKIEKYVEDHIDQPFTVNDVAAALFMNPDYLSRLFKEERELSIKEYIITRKMQSARILLKTTVLPVSIIASKLGYDNFSHFSQLYRRKMGISPTEERKDIADDS